MNRARREACCFLWGTCRRASLGGLGGPKATLLICGRKATQMEWGAQGPEEGSSSACGTRAWGALGRHQETGAESRGDGGRRHGSVACAKGLSVDGFMSGGTGQ